MGSSGPSTTTVVNTPPPRTAEEIEADRIRLEELRRQNDLAAALLPGQQQLIDYQNQLLQNQIANLPNLTAMQNQEMDLRRLQIQSEIENQAMMNELRPEQLKFLQAQNQMAMQQMQFASESQGFQREQNKYIMAEYQDRAKRLQARNAAYSPEEEANAAAEEARRATRMSALSEEAANIQLENLKRGNKPTEEQLTNINEAYDAAQAQGESDINKYLKDTLRTVQEETAQAAGLRATDAPVVRLSERAGEEAARAQGDLTSKVTQGRAQARLDYPLAVSKLTSDQAATTQNLAQGASEFQQQLAAQAASNRTQAFNMPSSIGFAMPQGGNPADVSWTNPGASGFSNGNPNSFNFNFNRGGGTSSTTGPGAPTNWGSTLGGLGSLISAGAMMFSDPRLKEDIEKIGETEAGLNIYKYRYKGDPAMRIGVMADETLRIFPEAVSAHRSGYLMVDHSKVR
jgi:hypothetical protein